MAECNHDCEHCSSNCGEREQESLLFEPHKKSNIKHVIGVISGKGGVGKSLVTSLLAVSKMHQGKNVAILDADITGPSIPKCFGIHDSLESDGEAIYPCESEHGVKVVSSNLLLENEDDPILWRGPLIASMVKQFYTDVAYGDVDYMFVDMPPGTGDVALTVFQSIKMDGIIIVTTPQDLVSMIVGKAIKMANAMNIKVYGLVENMSYVVCPGCGDHIEVFGHSKLEQVAKDYGLPVLGRIPIDNKLASACDAGKIEDITEEYFKEDF